MNSRSSKEIVQYIRKGRYGRIGAMVGLINDNGEIAVGWSKVTLRKKGVNVDRFNPVRATEIAKGRAIQGWNDDLVRVPHIILKNAPSFIERCKKYFKNFKPAEFFVTRLIREYQAKNIAKNIH